MTDVEMQKSGFIYIMANPYVHCLINVGMTTGNPFLRIRSEDLKSAGVPARFAVKYASWFPDVKLAGEMAHTALKKFHCYKAFFRTDIVTGINRIENLGLWYSRITLPDPFEPEQVAPCGNTQLISFDQFEPSHPFPKPHE